MKKYIDRIICSVDSRKRVVEFVAIEGSNAKASRRYQVSFLRVRDRCKRDYLTPQSRKGIKRKLDWEALLRHTQEYLGTLIRERKIKAIARSYFVQRQC